MKKAVKWSHALEKNSEFDILVPDYASLQISGDILIKGRASLCDNHFISLICKKPIHSIENTSYILSKTCLKEQLKNKG